MCVGGCVCIERERKKGHREKKKGDGTCKKVLISEC